MNRNRGVNLFSLQGRKVLITGATGYLGAAMSRSFAEAGAHVLINARSARKCQHLVDEITSVGFSAEIAVVDITDGAAVEKYFYTLQGSALHILVNNAYVGCAGGIEVSSNKSYQSSYDIGTIAAHNLLRCALPNLRQAVVDIGEASVINIASIYGMVSPDQRVYDSFETSNPPFYGAAKAALLQWTRYAACEFGHEGVRVNSISPGAFPSDLIQKADPDFIKRLENKIPLGRIGLPDELKGPALFLASPASSYINGANIVVDGGWTCW